MTGSASVILKFIPIYIKRYGTGRQDKDAIKDFIICEDSNTLRQFINEIAMVSQGKLSDEVLDKLVGPKRKITHGSYIDWAKAMLAWYGANKHIS